MADSLDRVDGHARAELGGHLVCLATLTQSSMSAATMSSRLLLRTKLQNYRVLYCTGPKSLEYMLLHSLIAACSLSVLLVHICIVQ